MTVGIKLSSAFFGLVLVILLGYGLTRGIFVGSTTEYVASMGGLYYHNCRYLYPNGVRARFGGVIGQRPNEVDASSDRFCPLLDR
jgi:hypothetical protein